MAKRKTESPLKGVMMDIFAKHVGGAKAEYKRAFCCKCKAAYDDFVLVTQKSGKKNQILHAVYCASCAADTAGEICIKEFEQIEAAIK